MSTGQAPRSLREAPPEPAAGNGSRGRLQRVRFAFGLTSAGWNGDITGRVPLLRHQCALVMTSTLFNQQAYDDGIRDAITRLIDDWGLRYPGIQRVDHEYFYAAASAPPDAMAGYLRRARELGRTFAEPAPSVPTITLTDDVATSPGSAT